MATDTLWRARNDIGHANILFTDDVYLRKDAARLEAASDATWEERNSPKQAVGRRAFRGWAATAYLPSAVQRVPQPFSEGRVVWVAATPITRAPPAGLLARWEERPGPT